MPIANNVKDKQFTTTIASSLFMNETYEPQRTNNFELQIVGIHDIVRAGYTNTGTHGYSTEIWNRLNKFKEDTTRELILSIKSAFSPKTSISVLEVQYGNTRTKFAGIPSYDNGTITWNDYYDYDTELILKAWQAAAFDETTGAVGDAVNYKRMAYLTMFSPSGRKARRWTLYNCWVSDVNGDDFSNDGNNVRGLAATFVFDRAVRCENVDEETSVSGLGNKSYTNSLALGDGSIYYRG